MKLTAVVSVLISLVLLSALPGAADDFAVKVVDSTKPLIGVGVVSCLVDGSPNGAQRAMRMSEAVEWSVLTARAIKSFTVSGFPSGHAAGAFAAATSLASYHPKQKWLYYGIAVVIGWDTVKSGSHTWPEAIAGAGLGYGIARISMDRPGGLIVGKIFRF